MSDFTFSRRRDGSYRVESYEGSENMVVIPSAYEGQPVTSIADNAFKGNKKLSSVTIPAGVTSIGKNVFAGCVALKKITIPANVTDIGAKAFSGDKNLKKITIQSAVLKKVGSGAFKNIHKKATIKVPK